MHRFQVMADYWSNWTLSQWLLMSLSCAGYTIDAAIYAVGVTWRFMASCVATVGGGRVANGGDGRRVACRCRLRAIMCGRRDAASTCRCLRVTSCRPPASCLPQRLQQAIRWLWEPLELLSRFFYVYKVAEKLTPFWCALTWPNINRFSKFYLLILLPAPSDAITDVIGIWSVFFESFVYKEFCDYESGTLNFWRRLVTNCCF